MPQFPQEELGGDAGWGMLNGARCGSQPIPSFPARRDRAGGHGWTRVPGPDCPGDGLTAGLQPAEIKGDSRRAPVPPKWSRILPSCVRRGWQHPSS